MAKKLKTSSEYAPVFNRIIVTCDAKNTTVSALLDSYATSRSAIGAWKKGNINTETIAAIADDLGVSLDYLIRGKENSVPSAELSDDEQHLLEGYRQLSDQGREAVRLTLFMAKETFKKSDISETKLSAV